jgi:hypothetical protein
MWQGAGGGVGKDNSVFLNYVAHSSRNDEKTFFFCSRASFRRREMGGYVSRVAHLLATAARWVRIQSSLKITKWAT